MATLRKRSLRRCNTPAADTLGLSQEQLDLLSFIIHDYKDTHRGDRESVLPAMALEADLNRLSGGHYIPDPTYDIK